MKKILLSTLFVISIIVITYLNLSISRVSQIESFLKASLDYIEEDTLGTVYIAALATSMEPNQTFLVEDIFYQNQIDNQTISAHVTILVYTEGNDPRPQLVVFIQDLNFKDQLLQVNEFTQIQSTFVFNEKVNKGRTNELFIDVTLSQLYKPNNQIFAIDSDYLFNDNQFNLHSIQLTIMHNSILYDLDIIKTENTGGLEETLSLIRSMNNTKILQDNLHTYNSVQIDEIYGDNVKFPTLNVIIEILMILGIYFLYQRLNLWYKNRYT